MKKKLILLVPLILLACAPAKETVPADVLNEEKMCEVLVTLNLSEALINHDNWPENKNKKHYNFNAFAENGISKDDFLKSMDFYSHHPALLKGIYEKVIEKLNRMKAGGK